MEGNKVKDMPEKWSGVRYHIISKKKENRKEPGDALLSWKKPKLPPPPRLLILIFSFSRNKMEYVKQPSK